VNISLKNVAVILISLACLLFIIARFQLFVDTAKNIYGVLTTTFEERKAAAYKELEYGYIKYIYDKLPDKTIFPTTRYPLYLQNAKIHFSDELVITKDIVLALNMDQKDFETNVIGNMDLVEGSTWSLKTYFDYDTFEGLSLSAENCSADIIELKITMYSTFKSTEPTTSMIKSIPCVENQPINVFLDEPIGEFSFGRGDSAFKFIIESDFDTTWKKIEALGIKVNVKEYTLINKDGKNHTYLKNSFIDIIGDEDDEEWTKFLSDITNV
jgi:hypothetical protein